MKAQSGSCHCGKVTFEFTNPVSGALQCNCSICSRKGTLWHAVPPDQFRITAGEDALSCYQFGTRTASHYFCKHCGVSTFSHPRIAPAMWVVNLRCVDDIDLASLPVTPFDGRNWEQAAQDFMRARQAKRVD